MQITQRRLWKQDYNEYATPFIENYDNSDGAYIICKFRIHFSRLVSLEPHSILISYDPDPTIPGALYGQSHACFFYSGWHLKSYDKEIIDLVKDIPSKKNFLIEKWKKIHNFQHFSTVVSTEP